MPRGFFRPVSSSSRRITTKQTRLAISKTHNSNAPKNPRLQSDSDGMAGMPIISTLGDIS